MTANDDNEEVRLTKGQLREIINCFDIKPIPEDELYNFHENIDSYGSKVANKIVTFLKSDDDTVAKSWLIAGVIVWLIDKLFSQDILGKIYLILSAIVYIALMVWPVICVFYKTSEKSKLCKILVRRVGMFLFHIISVTSIVCFTFTVYIQDVIDFIYENHTSAVYKTQLFVAKLTGHHYSSDSIKYLMLLLLASFICQLVVLFYKSVKQVLISLHEKWVISPHIKNLPLFTGVILIVSIFGRVFMDEDFDGVLLSVENLLLVYYFIILLSFMIVFISNHSMSKKYNEKYRNLIALKQSLEMDSSAKVAPVKVNIVSNLYSKMGLFVSNIKQKLGSGGDDNMQVDSTGGGGQNPELSYRRAKLEDLPKIVELLVQDDLGKTREVVSKDLDPRYVEAFKRIDSNQNQYLMIVEKGGEIVGTCHLTIMPSLTFTGSTRMQIEAVRVAEEYRGQKIGEWMMNSAIEYAKNNQVSIVQLTTNKQRERSKKFYERLGFEASHEGMKMRV